MRSRISGSRSVEWMRCVPTSMHSPGFSPNFHASMTGSARRVSTLTAAGDACLGADSGSGVETVEQPRTTAIAAHERRRE